MSSTCGPYEHLHSPKNTFSSGVIASYFFSFLKDHPVLWLPQSTPKAILHWDVDMKLMKWRIAERKLKFVSKIMARENSNITKRVLMSEVLMEDMQKVTIKGLAYECKSLSEEQAL